MTERNSVKILGEEFMQPKMVNSLVSDMRHSLSLNNRKILIDRDIDESLVIEWIYYINKIMEIDRIRGTKEPIEFIISCNGGSVEDGMVLVNQIEYLKSIGYKIITTNLSKAYSMAFIFSILGTERRCYKYSTYMYHTVSSMVYGKIKNMEEDFVETQRLQNIIEDIVLEHTHITREQLDEYKNKKIDKFISAEDAFKLGIVDIIFC